MSKETINSNKGKAVLGKIKCMSRVRSSLIKVSGMKAQTHSLQAYRVVRIYVYLQKYYVYIKMLFLASC